MPWAPPPWCAVPRPDAPQAVVTQQRRGGPPQKQDLSDKCFFLLGQEKPTNTGGDVSSWHAAVIRDADGKCFVMDLSSATGTHMNGQQLTPNKAYDWDDGGVVVLGKPPEHVKVTLQILSRQRGQKRPSPDAADPAKRRREDAAVGARPGSTSSGGATASRAPAAASKKCDKCDGPHPTDECPHFRKSRESHKDAWVNYGKKSPLQMGRKGGKLIVRQGRCVPQPGDGSCLFHSLCFGLNGGRSQGRFRAGQLRKELSQFLMKNPRVEISGDTLEEWVRWDAKTTVTTYARRMATGGWGGGIEMAVCSILKKVNVHVYERRKGGTFERISCFDSPDSTKQTIHVLYQGGVHYDALVPSL